LVFDVEPIFHPALYWVVPSVMTWRAGTVSYRGITPPARSRMVRTRSWIWDDGDHPPVTAFEIEVPEPPAT
jgi:hypothetical protein